MHTALVKLQDIRKSHALGKVEVTALPEVTLAIGAGEFVALSSFGQEEQRFLNLIGCIDNPS